MIERAQQVVRISLHGKVDSSSREDFLALLAPAEAADTVILDLSKTERLDSFALGHLVRLTATLSARGAGAIHLIGVQPHIRHLLSITGLDRMFALESHQS